MTIFEKFNKFKEEFGWLGFLRLFLYPVTVLVTTPFRLIQTIFACRILANDCWSDFPHFNPHAAINSLFYWTAAINIDRFGRSGISPHTGAGDYKLSRWFNYSLPSLYAYWGAGAVTILFGMFCWWLSHLIWLEDCSIFWLSLIMAASLVSTTFYVNTFGLQNYNAVGWAFFPVGLYGLMKGQWLTATLAWLAASFGSFTVVFIAGILSLVASVAIWSIAPLLTIFPAVLKLSTHFWPSWNEKDLKTTILSVVKAIGISDRSAKYKRTSSQAFGIVQIYWLLIYSQFAVFFYELNSQISPLFLTAIVLFILNSTYVRFADLQSIHMLLFSMATAMIIQKPEPLLLLSYWVLAAPLPIMLGGGIPSMQQEFDRLPKLAPFSVKNLREGMEIFLEFVKPGERVLMAFEDPNGIYEKIFDGYRVLLELPLQVSAKKAVHFMPDWWAVFELNYEGAPELWGRDIETVQANVLTWKADYVVIYQDSQTELSPEWQKAGFEVLSHFSWYDYEKDLGTCRPYSGKTPDWWLLKPARPL
jgi:hypothetical protein